VLAKYTWSRVFLVQYRLSSNPGGRFPAALQDTITAYKYLLDQGVPANKIVLSGDSAGGHCVLTFLRYLHDNEGVLPSPGGALLWSPWLDMNAAATRPHAVSESPNAKTDYLCDEFTRWGVDTFVPSFMKPSDPSLTFLGTAFKTDVPLWIQAGGVEVLYPDICQLTKEMKAVGNKVTYYEVPHANHDIFIIWTMTGFGKEMVECAKEVGKWFAEVGIESG
jgi:acetyl esterase/lipase